jgi:hypothetical protein
MRCKRTSPAGGAGARPAHPMSGIFRGGGHICRHALKRTQRPFFGGVGLSCTDCQKQALRRGSVGTDSLLELPDRPEPPGGSGVVEHRTQRSLLAPLADRSPSHSHPPIDERPHHKPRPSSGHAAICLAGLTFGAHPSRCHAPRRSVRIILLHAKSCRPCPAKRVTYVEDVGQRRCEPDIGPRPALLCQHRIEPALPGDIAPLTSPMMFHEVARQILRLEWCRDRGIAVWTSIGASPWSGRDVRFFAQRQRPIHFSLLAVLAAFSQRFGRATELLVFRRFGAIIFSGTHWFPPAGRGRGRAECLSATDGPDFFLILVVCLRWGRPIPIASLMRTPSNVRGPLPTKSASLGVRFSPFDPRLT